MKKASLAAVLALSVLIGTAAYAAAPAPTPTVVTAPAPQEGTLTAAPDTATAPQAWGNRMPVQDGKFQRAGFAGQRGMMRAPSRGMGMMNGRPSAFGLVRAIAGLVTLLMLWTLMGLSICALWKWHKKEKAERTA